MKSFTFDPVNYGVATIRAREVGDPPYVPEQKTTDRIVQVRPCIELDGEVTQCEESEADFFGVYHGGPGDLMWAADFNSLDDAINWATEIAENNECPLEVLT